MQITPLRATIWQLAVPVITSRFSAQGQHDIEKLLEQSSGPK